MKAGRSVALGASAVLVAGARAGIAVAIAVLVSTAITSSTVATGTATTTTTADEAQFVDLQIAHLKSPLSGDWGMPARPANALNQRWFNTVLHPVRKRDRDGQLLNVHIARRRPAYPLLVPTAFGLLPHFLAEAGFRSCSHCIGLLRACSLIIVFEYRKGGMADTLIGQLNQRQAQTLNAVEQFPPR